MAQILDGKFLAQTIQTQLKHHVEAVAPGVGRPPGLAVVMVGDNPASAAYVRNKERSCDRIGIASLGRHLPAETCQADVLQLIQSLNADAHVDGILLQLPVPDHLDAVALLNAIDADKDADGLHPVNLGRLLRGETGLRSCTPSGIMHLLKTSGTELSGQSAVILGRSILVGKPIALMLLAANATVTVAHSRTKDLAAVTRSADILVAAVGQPEFLSADQVKPGAVVIDVGINRVVGADGKGRLVGDVAYDAVAAIAAAITPVPGGVGPMTVAMLMHNTVLSYCGRTQSPLPPEPCP